MRLIWADTMFVNRGSRNVMEKLGMRHVATYFPELEPIEGSEHGEVRYELTADEWAGRAPGAGGGTASGTGPGIAPAY